MTIETFDDVVKFFDYLIKERKTIFHPDDPFELYINMETGEPTFTEEEYEELNEAMEQCFKVCEECGVDIYGIGFDSIIGVCDFENL